MISKFFIGILAVSTSLMAFFIYYAWSWLQSIGQPSAAAAAYTFHDSLAWSLLLGSTVVMLIMGNVILWLRGKAWAMWATLGYFSFFVLLHYFWLDQAFFHFKKANGLWDGSFSIGPLFGVILVVCAGVIVFLDQFAVVRLQRKMFPPAVEIEHDNENTPTDAESKAD